MQDKYGTGRDLVYCYPNSWVLKNFLNIREQEKLDEAEVEFTQYRLANFKYIPISEFSLETWKSLHFYLFQDIYEWAGEVRTVKITKDSTVFAMPMQIESFAQMLFRKMKMDAFLCNLERGSFVERLAYYFSELNMCHPFREGNGRSQRLLFELIAINAGYVLNWLKVEKNKWVAANVSAVTGGTAELVELFEVVVEEIPLK